MFLVSLVGDTYRENAAQVLLLRHIEGSVESSGGVFTLAPEPHNLHDPEAISVRLTVDGVRHSVGYIPRKMTGEVRAFATRVGSSLQNLRVSILPRNQSGYYQVKLYSVPFSKRRVG